GVQEVSIKIVRVGHRWNALEKALKLHACDFFVSLHEVERRFPCADVQLLLIGFQFFRKERGAQASQPEGQEKFGVGVVVMSEKRVAAQGIFKPSGPSEQQ